MYDLCKCWMQWILNHQSGRKTGLHAYMLSHFSRVWLYDPMDCNPPGSSVHDFPGKNPGLGCHSLLQGIFQHRSLMSSLMQAHSLPLAPPGKPKNRVRAQQSSHNIFINSSVHYLLWYASLFTDLLFNMYYWFINTELGTDSFKVMSEWTWISYTCICFIGFSVAFLWSGTLGKT